MQLIQVANSFFGLFFESKFVYDYTIYGILISCLLLLLIVLVFYCLY